MSRLILTVDGAVAYDSAAGAPIPTPIPPEPTPIPPQPVPVPPDGGTVAPAMYFDWETPGAAVDVPSVPGVTTPVVLVVPANRTDVVMLQFRLGYTSAGSDGKMNISLSEPSGKTVDGPYKGVNHEHGNLAAGAGYGTTVYPGNWTVFITPVDFSTPVRCNFSHQP